MELEDVIKREITSVKRLDLSRAVEELSQRYRENHPIYLKTHLHRLAYLCTRFPATLAALKAVLDKLPTPIGSCLELGAGFGPSLWALPELSEHTLLEQDSELITIGKRLYPSSAIWEQGDFTTFQDVPHADLTLFSYSLGETPEENVEHLLNRYWQTTKNYLVIIEPGTPKGFERIRYSRTLLLQLGAHLVAPCPHTNTCPMEGKNWCHFSARLPRTSLHRLLKAGTLGYEDEKYSYLIASKKDFFVQGERILRHPGHHRGHITLELCTKEGFKKKTITKKEKEFYKSVKKLKWGDLIFY